MRIAVDDLVPTERLFPLLKDFYRQVSGTRIKLTMEMLGGCWDALMTGRADLVIGAPGEAPPEGSLAVEPMGSFEFVFVVAPEHPLATLHRTVGRAGHPAISRGVRRGHVRATCRRAPRDCWTDRTP